MFWIACALALLVAACHDELPAEFPADYATSYTEVRACRASSDHDLHHIRVLADPAALGPYQSRAQAFPPGAVVLKEEFDFSDLACSGPIVEWTVMMKLATPMPDTLGWRWQHVDPDRHVVTQDEERCIGCHTACGVPPDGYDGTCAMPP